MLHKELGHNPHPLLRNNAQLFHNGFTGQNPLLHTYAQPCHKTLQKLELRIQNLENSKFRVENISSRNSFRRKNLGEQNSENNETGCISSYSRII